MPSRIYLQKAEGWGPSTRNYRVAWELRTEDTSEQNDWLSYWCLLFSFLCLWYPVQGCLPEEICLTGQQKGYHCPLEESETSKVNICYYHHYWLSYWLVLLTWKSCTQWKESLKKIWVQMTLSCLQLSKNYKSS